MQSIKWNWGIIAVVFLAFVLGMTVSGQRAESQGGDVGVYQLVIGEYGSVVKDNPEGEPYNVTTPGVFKVNTATGQCWLYTYGVVGGDVLAGWMLVEVDPKHPEWFGR
jgi:hypothetical protein